MHPTRATRQFSWPGPWSVGDNACSFLTSASMVAPGLSARGLLRLTIRSAGQTWPCVSPDRPAGDGSSTNESRALVSALSRTRDVAGEMRVRSRKQARGWSYCAGPSVAASRPERPRRRGVYRPSLQSATSPAASNAGGRCETCLGVGHSLCQVAERSLCVAGDGCCHARGNADEREATSSTTVGSRPTSDRA